MDSFDDGQVDISFHVCVLFNDKCTYILDTVRNLERAQRFINSGQNECLIGNDNHT